MRLIVSSLHLARTVKQKIREWLLANLAYTMCAVYVMMIGGVLAIVICSALYDQSRDRRAPRTELGDIHEIVKQRNTPSTK